MTTLELILLLLLQVVISIFFAWYGDHKKWKPINAFNISLVTNFVTTTLWVYLTW